MSWQVAWIALAAAFAADAPNVKINGQPVPPQAWAFLTLTRGVDAASDPAERAQLIDQLIERELIREFLAKQQIEPSADVVELRSQALDELIRRREAEPTTLYQRLGLSVDQVHRELGLAVAWESYVEKSVSPEMLRRYFDDHRSELDGTRVRVRQIFRKAPTDAAAADAELLLRRVKSDLEQGRTTFAAAAREHSQSPSREQGGDVGWIVGFGQLPEPVVQAALSLNAGELAGPIRSPFGVHLVQVTERQPGQLSLEDVRPQILERMAARLWRETTQRLRESARIEQ